MRRKWSVHQQREEEAGAGGGCGTGPGEKEAWLQGSMEGRKAERLKINYTHSATGGAKQHLPERQWHLSTTGMRTGSENFLPAEWSHPSFGEASWEPCYSWGKALDLSILRYSSQDGKEAAMSLQQMGSCVFPPYSGLPLPGQRDASCHPCDWERGPWSTDPGPSRWSTALALSDGALQWISTQKSCTYFPLWTLLHSPCRYGQNTGMDGAWGHTTQAGAYAHLQHSLAFFGTYSPPTE